MPNQIKLESPPAKPQEAYRPWRAVSLFLCLEGVPLYFLGLPLSRLGVLLFCLGVPLSCQGATPVLLGGIMVSGSMSLLADSGTPVLSRVPSLPPWKEHGTRDREYLPPRPH